MRTFYISRFTVTGDARHRGVCCVHAEGKHKCAGKYDELSRHPCLRCLSVALKQIFRLFCVSLTVSATAQVLP